MDRRTTSAAKLASIGRAPSAITPPTFDAIVVPAFFASSRIHAVRRERFSASHAGLGVWGGRDGWDDLDWDVPAFRPDVTGLAQADQIGSEIGVFSFRERPRRPDVVDGDMIPDMLAASGTLSILFLDHDQSDGFPVSSSVGLLASDVRGGIFAAEDAGVVEAFPATEADFFATALVLDLVRFQAEFPIALNAIEYDCFFPFCVILSAGILGREITGVFPPVIVPPDGEFCVGPSGTSDAAIFPAGTPDGLEGFPASDAGTGHSARLIMAFLGAESLLRDHRRPASEDHFALFAFSGCYSYIAPGYAHHTTFGRAVLCPCESAGLDIFCLAANPANDGRHWCVSHTTSIQKAIIEIKRFDPFGGSGSTAVAALALGRSCILLDASPDYLEIARRRLDRPHAAISAPAAKSPVPLPLFPEDTP